MFATDQNILGFISFARSSIISLLVHFPSVFAESKEGLVNLIVIALCLRKYWGIIGLNGSLIGKL